MKFTYSFFAILLWFAISICSVKAQVQMPHSRDNQQRILLNGMWKFKYVPSSSLQDDSLFYEKSFDTSNWATIKTPSNWELQGFAEPIYHKKLKEGTGLYRTNFAVPANWQSQPIYIAFDGVAFGYTFWINGRYAGAFSSAFNRQTFDISSFVIAGQQNTLAVKVSTHPKGWEFDTNDDWSLSGIYRDVTLFSLNPIHFKDVVLQTSLQSEKASLSIKAIIEKTGVSSFPTHLSLWGELISADGKTIKAFNVPIKPNDDVLTIEHVLTLDKPLLWSAENPYLYKVRLHLKDNSAIIQEYSEYVGIREVTWSKGIFKLNGTPIKLKGVTHHDLSPINGRAITETEIKQDLTLMRKANINFIRTSHYPPNPRLLELCDSLGFYVDDEVPYGFGDEHLKDSTYLPLLLQRAKSTIWRDKNHPCIIFWSVGNENPVTELGIKTGQFVKSLDPTRPYCFPQGPTDFYEMVAHHPFISDLLTPHYLVASEIKKLAKTIQQPLIMTEYAHALGLDFNAADEIFDVMYTNPTLAGGAVWEFFDQGILRKSSKKISTHEATTFVWPTENTFYDTADNQGTDGIVYADRTPQVDYFQLRKVYAPIRVLDTSFNYQAGKQTFPIKVVNRYDFTNLSKVTCKWQLWGDSTLLSSGSLPMNCLPHDTLLLQINASLPQKNSSTIHYLKVLFEDKEHYQFYEKSFPIRSKKLTEQLATFVPLAIDKPTKVKGGIRAANFHLDFSEKTGHIQLKNNVGIPLITEGLFARVGRKPSIAQIATTTSRRSKSKHTLWTNYLLSKASTVQVKTFDTNQLLVNYTFLADSSVERGLSGEIAYDFKPNGQIDVRYNFTPTGKEEAVETGVSMLIPASLSEFRWIGKGPYAAYPGKDKLSDYGIYHLTSNDLYFTGNRQEVECAIFSDSNGNGFALVGKQANISVEHTAEGILVSHNAHVAGTFNKYEWPEQLFSFQNDQKISGSFTIIPFTSKSYPSFFKTIFGNSHQIIKAFQPYFHSYDQ